MEDRYEKNSLWIKQADVNFLVIFGMGGSGKTTLARYIVFSNLDKFDNISLVEKIGSKWEDPKHLLELQKTLLEGVLGGDRKVATNSQATILIQKALKNNKALIVLDDIVDKTQLVELLGSGDIHKESKIIVTTRDTTISDWIRSTYGKCREYKMELLEDNEALELFSLHAFQSERPIEGYMDLAEQVVGYCEGNPLALEVLGSSLSNDISITHWESELDKLKRDSHLGINSLLIRSYESLQYESEKELFLHIACFFNGEDKDYVVKIFEHDCSAESSVKTLIKRCLLSISPNQTIMMHPLLQEMGRSIVHQESPQDPAQRTRVWRSKDSHDILRKSTGSRTVKGLALDNQELDNTFQGMEYKTDSFSNMHNLKLLNLKSVHLTGPYEHFSKDLKWLRWIGTQLSTIPSDLFMGYLVALDMSDSCLVVFEPPMDLQSLKIVNLKDSRKLKEIRNINKIPNLETFIVCSCRELVYVCETIGGLKGLALLNMTGCENLWKNLKTFPMPCSLKQLFLTDCKLEQIDSFNLNFSHLSSMQYLNLKNNLFTFLPNFNHLGNLHVLDLSGCSKLKELLSLPSTLTELYINHCESLEKITFASHRFTLQKLVCEGCTNLSEVEGYIKLVPVAKFDLGHMKWLKEYENYEICLVGGDELTKNKTCLQMVYEFGIFSTSLPDIKNQKMMPEFISEKTSTSLSFKVPECLQNRRLKGLNVTFKYTVEDDDWAWFAKISTTNGVDLMYNPTIAGRPVFGEAGIWLSYWPIGNKLRVKDKINVSIVVVRGLEVRECGASLVYADDDEVADETFEDDMGWVETLDGDLSAFQLSTQAYYLCRRDFLDKMQVDEPTPRWFRTLVGRNIDHAEVRGWRITGGSNQPSSSRAPAEAVTSSIPGDTMISETTFSDPPPKESETSASTNHIPKLFPKLYDVFLSIEAKDTRNAFVDHLNNALIREGMNTFRPADQIDSVEELKPEIERAIKHSKSSIVVLSENYANSPQCLDELVLIMNEMREHRHFVVPIFYKADPSDVRKQTDKFNINVKSSTRWTKGSVDRRMTALKEIYSIPGLVLTSGYETNIIRNIVEAFYNRLAARKLYTPPNLTGIDAQVKEINLWVNEPDVTVLVICGMGGSGKTTLARCIFNLFEENFESVSFLDNIGSRCDDETDLRHLQKTLLSDITMSRRQIELGFNSIAEDFPKLLGRFIQWKKTLIVLDDIVDMYQLASLIGYKDISGYGSKIIVTTRDASVKPQMSPGSWRCREYKMKPLNDSEALELLNLHAFRSRVPIEGYEELAKEALTYCEGNPAALEVLGSSLSGKSISEFKNVLDSWDREMHPKLYMVLIKSYNLLPNDMVKELFLHIACFFNGEEMDYVEKILGYNYPVQSAINILVDRHLLSASPNKKLTMHPLYKEMGRAIVSQESINLSERSRVWRDKDSYILLRDGKLSHRIEGLALVVRKPSQEDKRFASQLSHRIKGLALDMRKLSQDDEQFASQSSKLTTDALKHMNNLELLLLKFVPLTGSFKSFPKHLRLFCWHGFHLRAIPSDLYMGNTVAIDLSYSKLEEFEPPMILPALRILDLKDSHNLLKVHNISRLPILETLILSCCHMLAHVCETLGDLTNLTLLNMTNCEKLFTTGAFQRLLTSFFDRKRSKKHSILLPHSLERLFLKNCNIENSNYFPLSLRNQSNLQYLNLGNNMFEILPSYSHLINLRVLDLTNCIKLKSLLSLPNTLAELYINNCESLEKVTFESHRFTLQEFGCEGCISLSEIESIIKLEPVAGVDASYLGHMKWLKEYQDHEVCLVGNNELYIGRSSCVQLLYEFGIVSTSLPDPKEPNMTQHISESSSFSFDVHPYPENRRLTGVNVTFKYTVSGDDLVWFAKISTENGIDLMYNPSVFGTSGSGEVGMWFSYWPIGSKLDVGDRVTVSIDYRARG